MIRDTQAVALDMIFFRPKFSSGFPIVIVTPQWSVNRSEIRVYVCD